MAALVAGQRFAVVLTGNCISLPHRTSGGPPLRQFPARDRIAASGPNPENGDYACGPSRPAARRCPDAAGAANSPPTNPHLSARGVKP